jgi:hypothetical protein
MLKVLALALIIACIPLAANAQTVAPPPGTCNYGTLSVPTRFGVPQCTATGSVQSIGVGGEINIASTFTRPANTTQYGIGDLVGNTATAPVTPLSFNAASLASSCFRIERVRIFVSSTSLANASFEIRLFESSPTTTVGDNAVFDSAGALTTNNGAHYAGGFLVTLDTATSDGASGQGIPLIGNGVTLCPTAGTTAYALLEATDIYTPTSGEIVTVVIEAYRS